MLSATSAISLYTRQASRLEKAVANDAQVKRETEYFLANISSIKTAADLVKNPRLLNVATKAFGLSDMAYAKAFLTKLMDGGLTNSKSMANTMVDRRFRAFVETFNFGDLKQATTLISARMQGVVDNYKRQVLEDRAGATNPAARLALFFQRQAPNIDSGMDFLADKALTQFVQTALAMPAAPLSTNEALRSAAAMIERRIDFDDLKTPAGVEKLTKRFAAMWDLTNPTDNGANALTSLLGTSSSTTYSTLLQLQRKYSGV